MQQAVAARTPAHLWIVGILALLWNCFGAYDYTMTRLHNLDYLKGTMPGVDPNVALDWVESMPMYAQAGWGLGVWFGLLGAVLLLIRSRWAVWSFGISLVGAVLSLGYQLLLAPPIPGATESPLAKVIPILVIVIAAALFLYARAQEKKSLLR
jgi:hypothetical protein